MEPDEGMQPEKTREETKPKTGGGFFARMARKNPGLIMQSGNMPHVGDFELADSLRRKEGCHEQHGQAGKQDTE